MLASAVDHLPVGDGMLYEPKWDGFRCLSETGPARMYSKSGRSLASRWPEIADALAQLPDGVMVDGELIRWANDGHLNFRTLLRRSTAAPRRARTLSRSEPCHYIVFDLLSLGGRDLTHQSLSRRRTELEHLMSEVTQPSLITLGWQTDNPNVAMQWWREMPAVGVEGVMIKDSRRSYRPGRRDWRKYKSRTTTEAIVGGVVGHARAPRALILGRVDRASGDLRVAGRTSDLSPEESEEIAEYLTKTDDHPWPATLAATWGQHNRQHYSRVVPDLVVEVSPDTAVVSGRWRHVVRYLRPRPDLRPEDVPANLDTEG